ncbi:hypothetical protein AAII07_55110 [Microvirga sp. 0TCS3.31]
MNKPAYASKPRATSNPPHRQTSANGSLDVIMHAMLKTGTFFDRSVGAAA